MPRVLLLDDEPLITMLLEDILEQLGYEIVGPAHTVAVALGLIEATPPDAAILISVRNCLIRPPMPFESDEYHSCS
jgi:YesN/AraC family two-component response regulator